LYKYSANNKTLQHVENYRAFLGLSAALFGLMPLWLLLFMHLREKFNNENEEADE